jgi:hypothetical protein
VITGRSVYYPPEQRAFDFVPVEDFQHNGNWYVEGYKYHVSLENMELQKFAKSWAGLGLVSLEEPLDGNYACN